MRISDWSSDVCSSDLTPDHGVVANAQNTGVTGSLDLIIGADGLGTVSLLGNEGLSDVTSGGQPVTYVVDPSDPSLLIAHTGGDETDESRSEERRVGKECVSTCSSRWSPYH